MKKIALIVLAAMMVGLPLLARTFGPDSQTVSATTAGVKVKIGDPESATPFRETYVSCANDGISISAWRYDGSAWNRVSFGASSEADSLSHAPADMILPIMGKYDVLIIYTDTSTYDVDVHSYVN